jgi:two-component system response regulator YesN
MNILIVDDEYYIVQGIAQNTNWQRLGIDNIFTAYSMKQAQEILNQHQIDILLTDIEMPKGSGLDLITWVNAHTNCPVKLLLTGHQNFSYAQKAIVLECFQYIVKPVQTVDLEAVLMDAVSKVKVTRELNRAKNIMDSWDADKLLRFETFWSSIFSRLILPDENSITNALHRLSLPLTWANEDFYFMLLHIQPKTISKDKINQVPLDVINPIIAKQFEDCRDSSIYKVSPQELILPIPSYNFAQYQDAFRFCETLRSNLQEAVTSYRFSLYLSDNIALLHAADCYQVLKNFQSNTFATESIVIPVHALALQEGHDFSDNQLKDLPLPKWSEYLLQSKSNLILENIKAIFKADTSYYPVRMLIALYYGILQTVFSVLESKEISINELFPKLVWHTDFVKATSSIEEFLYWSHHLLQDTEEILKVNSDSASFVEAVKKFVKTHLNSEDLNRNTIADAIHMNPDYVSYLFHKQSGMLLNTYITNERINAAKKLLMTTDMSLQEIADATGFSNSSYFHKQFKKVTGVTPQQYRSSGNSE